MKNVFDSFFTSDIHTILPIMIVGMSIPIFIYLSKSKEISRFKVILSGLGVITLSALSFFYINSMIDFVIFVSKSDKLDVSLNVKEQFVFNSKIIIFLFPLIFTAIGVNIVSGAITHDINYKK